MIWRKLKDLTPEERSWMNLSRTQLRRMLITKNRMFRHLIRLNIKARRAAERGRETDRQRLLLLLNAVLTKYGNVSLTEEDLKSAKRFAISVPETEGEEGEEAIVFTELIPPEPEQK